MFSKVDFDVVSFVPSESSSVDGAVEKEKSFQNATSQTERNVLEGTSQTHSKAHLGVQTEGVVKSLNAEYDVDKLASFLSKVCPSVINELNKVEKSKAFTLYQTAKEDEANTLKVLHSIQSETIPQIPGVRVSCLAWSCTGNVVAFGYECPEHTDWCTHSSCVDFYNIKTSDFNGKTPSYSVPTSSCVTALSTHPYEPAIVAVGTAGGEVHVWNLQKGQFDADIGNSIFHEDRVTKVSWENINSQLFLVTCSLDSYIFFYKVTPSISSVILTERYVMTNDLSHLRAGITTFDFSIQPGVFIVALENGEIIHCSTFGAPNVASSSAKNPVLRPLYKKTALVRDLRFSPFIDHIFVAAFTDNKFVAYSLKETAPLYEIFLNFDVLGLTWSTMQCNIVFLWGKSSKFFVLNSENGKVVTELSPETSTFHSITTASFASKSTQVTVSEEGKVMVWELPRYFKI